MFGPRLGVRTLDAALRDVQSEKPDIRQAAARDLAVQRDEEQRSTAVEALCGALEDEVASVRAAAALALADLDAREAAGALSDCCKDEDSHVRAMALTALGEIGEEGAFGLALEASEDNEAEVRFAAVIAAVRCAPGFQQALDAILQATEDEDPAVIHIALRMAEELGHRDSDERPVDPAVRSRVKVLIEHEAVEVKVLAAVILGRCKDKLAAAVLLDVVSGVLKTKEPEDEAAAIVLCGELRFKKALGPLRKRAFGGLFGLGGDPFAWHARVALAALGQSRAQAWILSELKAWNRERRTLAVAAATQAKLHCAIDLIRAMDGDSSRAAPEAVAEALRVLGTE